MLTDLGADVIAVEPLSGSPLRPGALPPRRAGRGAFIYLVVLLAEQAPRLFDSRPPTGGPHCSTWSTTRTSSSSRSRPDTWTHSDLGTRPFPNARPGLIVVSITRFGQEGPKSAWAASDLTIWASSGALNLTGDDDLAPVRVSVPQANLHPGAEAAVAALVALAARQRDGRGQHIDVSAQTASMIATQSFILAPAWNDLSLARIGGGLRLGPLFVRFVYPCKDGFVNITLLFGNVLGLFTRRLFEWMHEEGFVDAVTRDKDWVAYLQLLLTGEEPIPEFERAMAAIEQFTLSHTKAGELPGDIRPPRAHRPRQHTGRHRRFESARCAGLLAEVGAPGSQ